MGFQKITVPKLYQKRKVYVVIEKPGKSSCKMAFARDDFIWKKN